MVPLAFARLSARPNATYAQVSQSYAVKKKAIGDPTRPLLVDEANPQPHLLPTPARTLSKISSIIKHQSQRRFEQNAALSIAAVVATYHYDNRGGRRNFWQPDGSLSNVGTFILDSPTSIRTFRCEQLCLRHRYRTCSIDHERRLFRLSRQVFTQRISLHSGGLEKERGRRRPKHASTK